MFWRDAKENILQPIISLPRLGLVTDMDGTISPIVHMPHMAQVTPKNRELLRKLHKQLPLVAVISGRAAADVRDRVDNPDLVYVGNHGLEWSVDNQIEIAPEAQQYRPALEIALREVRAAHVPGMVIEDKGATLSVHYRRTTDPDTVAAAFTPVIQDIADQHGLSLFQGRMVYEIRPPVAINKGSAFAQLIERYHLDAALFLGDDTTDADALRMARRLRQEGVCEAFGLGVLSDDAPLVVRESADLWLSGVSDVEAFLDWLSNALNASSS